jgi:aryl-alcohol dehydrogenase-like predicted oxidoreductase
MRSPILGGAALCHLTEFELGNLVSAYASLGGSRVDISPAYGGWSAVERLGKVLRQVSPQVRPILKLGYFQRSASYADHAALAAQAHRAIDALGQEPASILLHEADWDAWWPSGVAPWTRFAEDLPELALAATLRDIARPFGCKIGVAGNNAERVLAAAIALGGDTLMLAKQIDLLWSAGDDVARVWPMRGELLLAAPFHQGWLFKLDELADRRPDLCGAASELAVILAEFQVSPVSIALPYIAAGWPTASVVVGCASTSEVNAAFESLRTHIPDELIKRIGANRQRAPAMKGVPLHEAEDDLLTISSRR